MYFLNTSIFQFLYIRNIVTCRFCAGHMEEDANVFYKIHEPILILICFKFHFFWFPISVLFIEILKFKELL